MKTAEAAATGAENARQIHGRIPKRYDNSHSRPMYEHTPKKKRKTTNWYVPPLYNHSSIDADSQIGYMCTPIAFELGTTAPDMMLFPYSNDPATGSRIPSISTGGAA